MSSIKVTIDAKVNDLGEIDKESIDLGAQGLMLELMNPDLISIVVGKILDCTSELIDSDPEEEPETITFSDCIDTIGSWVAQLDTSMHTDVPDEVKKSILVCDQVMKAEDEYLADTQEEVASSAAPDLISMLDDMIIGIDDFIPEDAVPMSFEDIVLETLDSDQESSDDFEEHFFLSSDDFNDMSDEEFDFIVSRMQDGATLEVKLGDL